MDELSALRRRYAVALRAGRMGTFEFDPDSGEVSWDEAFEQLLMVDPSDAPRSMGDYAALVHPEDLDQAMANAVACVEGKTDSYEHEYRMRRTDGSELWVRTSVTRIHPPRGGTRLIGVCADITAQRRAETSRAAAIQAERVARQAAETSHRRLELLAQVATLLESPPDLLATLQRVADLATGVLADWCVVDLIDPDGRTRAGIAHRDPAMLRLAEEVERRWPPPADDPVRAQIIATRQPVHIPVVDDAMIEAGARDDDHLAALKRFSMSSAAVVPVQAGGVTLGLLSLLATEGRRISPDDVELAVELGRRAGAAVERVRAEAERARVANALQRALLPPALPTVPGVELAAAYEPAGSGAAVGGDFYDVVTTGDDRWWVAVGDVQGKGPEAAAVTGTIRHVLRTVEFDCTDPAEVLERAQAALHQSLDQRSASVVLVTFVAGGGPLEVHVASAGHPPPLLRYPTGQVEELAGGGVLMGVGESVGAGTAVHRLDHGDVLLLYTDGATDAPVEGGRLEETGLRDLVAGAEPKPAAVVDAVITHLRAGPAGRRDDIALLALGPTD